MKSQWLWIRSNSAAHSNASEMCRYSATLGSTAGSSSYPLSTTACRRARVTESLLANNVTSQPRATSPSVMLLATVSQAPYFRGGVRQAIGDRIATLFLGFVMLLEAKSVSPYCSSLRKSHSVLLEAPALCVRWFGFSSSFGALLAAQR